MYLALGSIPTARKQTNKQTSKALCFSKDTINKSKERKI
jgi:hypothetical protein